jgi:hypothetical protein
MFFGVLVLGACYGMWKMRGLRKKEFAEKDATHGEFVRSD